MTAIFLAALVVAGLIINGLRLRARVPSAIPPAGGHGGRDSDLGAGQDRDWAWLTTRSTAPDEATRRATVAYAHASGLDLLELVPADLSATAARDLIRRIDPRAYTADRLAVGRGAGAAILTDRAVAALVTGWPWGLGALVAYCLQPYLIFAGTALRPRGLHAAALLRPVHDPLAWARTAAGRRRSAAEVERDAAVADARAYYRGAMAEGTARFFESRRPDCPWCGSASVSVLVRSPDLVLRKPGTFTLDRCGGCGHVFQNPRLTSEGLDFYYRDVYDGLGADDAESVFAAGTDSYLGRAKMVAAVASPKSWLDVGAGHAHFCAIASDILPDTVLDGLDQGAVIEEAERRGWISTAYRGEFPDLADELAGRYDLVSMHHYLEHTREPLGELDAAARVVLPGGHLLIELPDPQWPLAKLFGSYWMPWFQPQHQHMMPLGNLTAALAARGLRTVAIERGQAHQATDFVTATALLLLLRLAGDRAAPWAARPPSAVSQARQGLVWIVGAPAVAVCLLLDRTLVSALARRWNRGNAYRVLARREDSVGDDR